MATYEYPLNISKTGFFIQLQFFDRKKISKLVSETFNPVKKRVKNKNKNNNKTICKCGGGEKVTVVDTLSKVKNVASDIITKSLLSELVLKDTINLYIPNDMEVKHHVNVGWSLESQGALGMTINALKNSKNIEEAIKNNSGLMFTEGLEGIGKTFIPDATEKIKKVKRSFDQIHGVVPKKDDELMFLENVSARTQNLSFRFMPRDKEEYELIKSITETILLNTYPDLGEWGIMYPPIVQLRVFFKNKLVVGYRNMQINDCEIPLMSEGFQVYEDGNPAVVDLKIALQEGGKYYKKHYINDAKTIYKKR